MTLPPAHLRRWLRRMILLRLLFPGRNLRWVELWHRMDEAAERRRKKAR